MAKKEPAKPTINVTDCQFYGVKWDAQAVEAITLIATGLIDNAQALGALAEVLRSSNVHIETLLKVSPEGKVE